MTAVRSTRTPAAANVTLRRRFRRMLVLASPFGTSAPFAGSVASDLRRTTMGCSDSLTVAPTVFFCSTRSAPGPTPAPRRMNARTRSSPTNSQRRASPRQSSCRVSSGADAPGNAVTACTARANSAGVTSHRRPASSSIASGPGQASACSASSRTRANSAAEPIADGLLLSARSFMLRGPAPFDPPWSGYVALERCRRIYVTLERCTFSVAR